MPGNHSMPRVKVVADVHSRVHYCKEGVILRLTGGLGCLVVRSGGPESDDKSYCRRALCVGEELLADIRLGKICTIGAFLSAGYGNGLMNDAACRAASDRVNEPFQDMAAAVQGLEPLMGLLASGLYLVTDCELQPVYRHWANPHHCLDEPGKFSSFDEAMGFDGHNHWDIPFYFIPVQRASVLDPDRIRYYMEQLEQAPWRCPRAITLYLNGSFSLLLDGHHKAAAAAALGKTLPTLMIYPLQNEAAVASAIRAEKKLEFCQHKWNHRGGMPDTGPLYLADEALRKITHVRDLQYCNTKKEPVPHREELPWGKVPEEFCSKMDQYPSSSLLHSGTAVSPDRIKSVMRMLMETPWPFRKDIRSMDNDAFPSEWVWGLDSLAAFARLFPESPMLTQQQRQWLERTRKSVDKLLRNA